jgi:hypothetical protein
MSKNTFSIVKLLRHTGSFAENKDAARKIRENYLEPKLRENKEIIIDYSGISSTTQSFTHALISDLIRIYGDAFFAKVSFKNCNPTVQRVIKIVSEYMQRTLAN